MNQNHYQLLSLFTAHEKTRYPFDELIGMLGLGKRSVLNYIAEVNGFLSGNGFHTLQVLPDNTVEFCSSSKEIKEIRKKYFALSSYDYHYSFEERVSIIKLLLFRYNRISISTISNLLSTSKATTLSDMKEVIHELREKDIPVISNTYGYQLDVNEVFRRDYLILSFHSQLNMSSKPTSVSGVEIWINQHYQVEQLNRKLYPVLSSWQQSHSLTLEGYQLFQLNWILTIMLDRMKQGNYLLEFPVYNNVTVVNIALDLLTKVLGNIDYDKLMPEVHFLASYLEGIQVAVSPQFPLGNIPSNAVIHTFLANIGNDLRIILVNDKQLFEQLSNHIKSFFSILERSIPFDSKLMTELQKEYPQIVNSVKNNLYILEQSFHRIYNEGETTFLVMHIAAAVSRILSENCTFNILLVCDSGLAISSYIIDKLSYYCKIDRIETTTSIEFHNYLRTTDYCPNLILSFHPDFETNIPVVLISPELSSQDISRIQDKMYEFRTSENTLINRSMFARNRQAETTNNLIRPEMIALDLKADTWIDAIQMCGNILLANDAITQSYIDSIIRAVYINGPYFVFWPGVALAHAEPAISETEIFAASMIRLRKPIWFGSQYNDPVKYVFMFYASELENDVEKMIKLISICASPTLFQKLDECSTADEIFRLIMKE